MTLILPAQATDRKGGRLSGGASKFRIVMLVNTQQVFSCFCMVATLSFTVDTNQHTTACEDSAVALL